MRDANSTDTAQSGPALKLTCERMTYGSDAVAHTADGKTVFVSGAVAGDTVEARVQKDGRSFSRAIATKLISPSPNRVTPACPYASVCGGCPWSALAHEAQLEAKRSNVVDALIRIGHFGREQAEALVAPCEAPSPAWGYRNKVELAFVRQGNKPLLGMHAQPDARGGVSVVKVDACPLLDSRYKKLVKSVSGALAFALGTGAGGLEIDRVGIRASARTRDIEVALWTKPGPFPRARVAKVLGDACKASSVVRVLTKGASKARKVTGVEVLSGKGCWRENLNGETLYLSAPSFFQVNTRGAERLCELVLEGLKVRDGDTAMDLYSGAGTFTLPLARHAEWVSAVEASGPAVRDLRRNLEAAGLHNAEPIGGDANREYPQIDADVVVVDPPRAGLAQGVVDQLCAERSRTVAYVSCNPATLSRDLARFVRNGALRPACITPVDLFPETYHVETVTILQRQ